MFNPRDSPPITGNEKKLELNVYKGDAFLLLISDEDEAVRDWPLADWSMKIPERERMCERSQGVQGCITHLASSRTVTASS